jgi:hypothetical protein
VATTTYEPIQTQTLGSASGTVTFSSIPQTYTDLIIVVSGATASGGVNLQVRFNSDSGNNYSTTRMIGNGSSASSDRIPNYSAIIGSAIPTTVGNGNIILQVQNYANSNTYKTMLIRGNNASVNTAATVGLWRGSTGSATQAITSISLSPEFTDNWSTGSTFTLYGIANAQIEAPKATGGTITYDNTYFYHTFGASGTFTPTQSLTADILVVAGGGGGGRSDGGGGGAGGLLGFAAESLTATGYTVTVGAGGTGGVSGVAATTGNDSRFGTLTLVKGGGLGGGFSASGGNGGSGGGAGAANSTSLSGGSPTSGQGNSGGSNSNSGTVGQRLAGGGGGAGAVGGNATLSNSGSGGIGSSTYSSWGAIAGVGQNSSSTVYFAGGGGGGSDRSVATFPGAGGLGGGGAGAPSSTGQPVAGAAGLVNTGGGGGGGASGTAPNNLDSDGGAGGSGVVIVRYLK